MIWMNTNNYYAWEDTSVEKRPNVNDLLVESRLPGGK